MDFYEEVFQKEMEQRKTEMEGWDTEKELKKTKGKEYKVNKEDNRYKTYKDKEEKELGNKYQDMTGKIINL